MNEVAAVVADALDALVAATGVDRLLIAYSGGRDSTALLHASAAFARARGLALAALHVDHGLHVDSAQWARQCHAQAHALGVPCEVVRVAGAPAPGASIEAWARERRYALLAAASGAGTAVLSAHHGDDQIETVLQRVLQGAGPHGVAGMRARRALGVGHLARPLLGCRRRDIDAYLERHGLAFVEDPANVDLRFLRSRLRHRLWPEIERSVPGARAGLERLARLQGELAHGLDRLADAALGAAGASPRRIPLAALAAVGPELSPYVVRRALDRAGWGLPGARRLHEIVRRVCSARSDAEPVVRWGGQAVRRYRDALYLTAADLPRAPSEVRLWHPPEALEYAWGRLCGDVGEGQALAFERVRGAVLSVTFRRGGERCRPCGRAHSQSLKKLFQTWGVPPWERALIPLVHVDGELAAVPGYCVCAPFAAGRGERGLALEWQWLP